MPIDTSIYQNIKPVEMPSPMDTARSAMSLSQLGLQQQQMQYQMAQTQALRQAYARNTDGSGTVDRAGFLSDLGKVNPSAVPGAQMQFAQQDKAQAEAQGAQAESAQKALTVIGPKLDYLAGLNDSDRTAAYPKVLDQLKQEGIDTSKMNPNYDPGEFRQHYLSYQQSKPYLEKLLTQSEIQKNNMDPMKTGAEELGKLNEDANNPTNRKTTGGLKDIVNRADRIVALANAGAPPNETPDQRAVRLNKIMPQIAKEFNISLATIMQGGVPTEGLEKELGTDTADSAIAGLKQRFSGTPTGANQGAMIQQYVDTAQHLRNFASQRLQDINQRSKAAYPYANRYFPNQVSKILSPIAPIASSGQSTGDQLVQDQQSGAGADKVRSSSSSASTSNQATKYTPGAIVMVNGRHYRVSVDGDSLLPVQGNKK